MKRTFKALTTVVRVEIDDDLPSAELAAMLVDAYPDSDDLPLLDYRLHRGGVSCANRYNDLVDDVDDVVPMFELDLYQEVAWRASRGWLLHAAALEIGGRVVVFAGPSGAGKTTLTLGLMKLGWKLLTEEMVLIDRELFVHGLARPIHAPGVGPQRDALPATWRLRDYPLRTADAKIRNAIAQPPQTARITTPLPLHAIVRLDHAPDCRAEAVPLSPHAAIPLLWACTLRQDADGLAAATEIIGRIRPLHLTSSTPAQAVEIAGLISA